MSPIALIFFAIFFIIVLVMYVTIRRRMAPTGVVAAVGVLGSILAMTLFSLAQGSILLQAIIYGIVIGGAFSIASLVIAWYFQGNDARADYQKQKSEGEASAGATGV